jgi:hypothetical protein
MIARHRSKVHPTGRSLRTPYGQSSSLCGLELVPVKWHYLFPPQAALNIEREPLDASMPSSLSKGEQ